TLTDCPWGSMATKLRFGGPRVTRPGGVAPVPSGATLARTRKSFRSWVNSWSMASINHRGNEGDCVVGHFHNTIGHIREHFESRVITAGFGLLLLGFGWGVIPTISIRFESRIFCVRIDFPLECPAASSEGTLDTTADFPCLVVRLVPDRGGC